MARGHSAFLYKKKRRRKKLLNVIWNREIGMVFAIMTIHLWHVNNIYTPHRVILVFASTGQALTIVYYT